MLAILAFRHLLVKKGRSLFLLLGYGLGVGVMIVLLSVGQAMLDQSRDVSLVGGGEVTVLPQGIDVEAMRTGGASGMFFTIERARFLTRQLLGGPRHAAMVRAVSPAIEHKLLYLRASGETTAVRAGGEIPSRARALGAGLDLLAGAWDDSAADSAWMTPTPGQLYDELDRFHLPTVTDTAWGEWHYFNLATGPREWWYITYLVGGEVLRGRWGGQLLIAHRRPGGGYDRFAAAFPAEAIALDTTAADLSLGANRVRQRDGIYTITAAARGPAGPLTLALTLRPEANRYFPPVDLREGDYPSGYVVPALSATASGRICLAAACTVLADAPAYHDHNWGVWREVTWDWGAARGATFNLLYGAVYAPDDTIPSRRSGAPRLFVTLVDSLGVRQILRAREVRYTGPAGAPTGFGFTAVREADTVRVEARVQDVQASAMVAAGVDRKFLQMRGTFRLEGTLGGQPVRDEGTGFFETYVRQESGVGSQ